MATFRNLRERVESLPSRNPQISQAFFYKEIPSTNLDAMSRGKMKAPAGSLSVADSQSNGRGRLDRKWESPAGKGLYFSLLLRPSLGLAHAPLLTLAAGLGIARVLRELGVPGLMVKWPNDLSVQGKKLGGILSEMSSRQDQVDFVVIGVGINISAEAADFSPEVAASATSLKQIEEKTWDRGEILENLVSALMQEVQTLADTGPEALIARWEAESGMVGAKVRVQVEGQSRDGKVIGLAKDGQLKIKTDSGETIQILTGDTILL